MLWRSRLSISLGKWQASTPKHLHQLLKAKEIKSFLSQFVSTSISSLHIFHSFWLKWAFFWILCVIWSCFTKLTLQFCCRFCACFLLFFCPFSYIYIFLVLQLQGLFSLLIYLNGHVDIVGGAECRVQLLELLQLAHLLMTDTFPLAQGTHFMLCKTIVPAETGTVFQEKLEQ